MKNLKKMNLAKVLFIMISLVMYSCRIDNNCRKTNHLCVNYKRTNTSTVSVAILHYKNKSGIRTDAVYATLPFTKTMMFFRTDMPIQKNLKRNKK